MSIKKTITIEVEYGSEFQENFHHKNLMMILEAHKYMMFCDTNYTMYRHKDNSMEIIEESND